MLIDVQKGRVEVSAKGATAKVLVGEKAISGRAHGDGICVDGACRLANSQHPVLCIGNGLSLEGVHV